DRKRRGVLPTDGADFRDPAVLREAELVIAVLRLDGEGGLPAVHGPLFDGRENPSGEFSFLDVEEGGSVLAGRDLLGTRPLYVSRDGTSSARGRRFISGPEAGRRLPAVRRFGTTVAARASRCSG